MTLACRSATREGGHATTHRGSGRGRRAGEGWFHAVTQALLSILVLQCGRPLSLTSHLSAAALTCSVNTLSFLSLSVHTAGGPGQARPLPSGGAQPLQVTLTHDRALACPSGFGGEGGSQRLPGGQDACGRRPLSLHLL